MYMQLILLFSFFCRYGVPKKSKPATVQEVVNKMAVDKTEILDKVTNLVRNEPHHHEKTGFSPMRKERCRSAVHILTAQLISAFVFATQIVQSLFFLNLKFQASSYFL